MFADKGKAKWALTPDLHKGALEDGLGFANRIGAA